MTANQLEYSKELKRIKQAVRRAEKRGYRFFEDVLPQTPKRVTKQALQRIKEITTPKIYEKAEYLDENTGKIVSGSEGRKLEAQERARKAQKTKQRKKDREQYYPDGGGIIFTNVLEQFIQRLSEPPVDFYVNRWGRKGSKELKIVEASERAKSTLLSITYSAIEKQGKSAVGWRLERQADEVNTLINYILYGSNAEGIASACTQLATIINGGALSMQDLQDLSEQEEYNESHELPI